MSKECPKLTVMHNLSIVKKSNSWTMDEVGSLHDHKSANRIELSQLVD